MAESDRISILERIAGAWNAAGLRYGVAHGLEAYPQRLGRDIDVMIERPDLSRAVELCRTILAEDGWSVVEPPNVWRARWVFAVRRDDAVEIDLIPALTWGPVALCTGRGALGHRKGPFEISLSGAFAKCVLIRLLGGVEVRVPSEDVLASDEVWRACGVVLGRARSESLRSALAVGATGELLTTFRLYRRAALTRAGARPARAVAATAAKAATAVLDHRWHAAPVVSVLGPDGVGKSSALASVECALPQFFTAPTIRHSRPGILRPLAVLLGRAGSDRPGGSAPRRSPGRGQLLRALYYWPDYAFGPAIRDYPECNRVHPVIYDRSAIDMVVDPVRYAFSSPRFPWLTVRTSPRPDAVIALVDQPAAVRARKPELDESEIARQVETLFELLDVGAVDYCVPVSDGTDVAVAGIAQAVVDAFMSRDRAGARVSTELQAMLRAVGFESAPRATARHVMLRLPGGRAYVLDAKDARSLRRSAEMISAGSWKARVGRRVLAMRASGFLVRLVGVPLELSRDGSSLVSDVIGVGDRDVDIAVCFSLGAPGPSRKPVALVSGAGLGDYVLKYGWNDSSRAHVRAEHAALGNPAFRSLGVALPEALSLHVSHGVTVGVQTSVPGSILDGDAAWGEEVIRFTCSAIKSRSSVSAYSESEMYGSLEESAEACDHAIARSVARELLRECSKVYGDVEIVSAPAHGDMVPWNAKRKDGAIALLDWEWAELSAPAGWDVVHYFAQANRLLRLVGPVSLANGLLESGDLGAMLSSCGIDSRTRPALVATYLTRQLLRSVSGSAAAVPTIRYYAAACAAVVQWLWCK